MPALAWILRALHRPEPAGVDAFDRLGEHKPSGLADRLPCGSGRPEQRQRSPLGAQRRARRQAQMRKYPDHHGGLLDGGSNLQVTATMRAVFDINVENALEQARSAHALHEFQRRHLDVRGAVAIGALQLQHDLACAIALEPFVGDTPGG